LALVTDLDPIISVVISTSIVAGYTSMGAMYSVTYTDVVQLFLVVVGLVISAAFAIMSPVVNIETLKKTDWVGSLPAEDVWKWLDTMALLILGGMLQKIKYVLVITSIRSNHPP